MMNIQADSIDEIYTLALTAIRKMGDLTKPRGFVCQEISPFNVTLTNIQNNVLMNLTRKASRQFMAAEFLWILLGRNDTKWIRRFSKKITEYSDDGQTFFGAYGPKILGQLPYIINSLLKDPWSRQAVLNIWRESPPKTRDFPCTIMMHFIQRPIHKLNLITYIRSQDLWLGLPYDVHNFTSLQLFVAGILGLEPGYFKLIQGSLHLYEEHFEKVDQLLLDQNCLSEKTPLGSEKGFFELLTMIERPFDLDSLPITDPLLRQKVGWLK